MVWYVLQVGLLSARAQPHALRASPQVRADVRRV